jgi:hypothetical protein
LNQARPLKRFGALGELFVATKYMIYHNSENRNDQPHDNTGRQTNGRPFSFAGLSSKAAKTRKKGKLGVEAGCSPLQLVEDEART